MIQLLVAAFCCLVSSYMNTVRIRKAGILKSSRYALVDIHQTCLLTVQIVMHKSRTALCREIQIKEEQERQSGHGIPSSY